MSQNRTTADAGARPRFHGIVTTMLVMALSFMVVRDILVRRWGSATPTSSDVTRPLP
jgi:hypothetical protein